MKSRGYALDDEENEAGISCVAVLFFDKNQFSCIRGYGVSSLRIKIESSRLRRNC
ncbi:hypothetical protein O9993_11955 [Vibrio lentus]|nr:hypothetical protein [Vibrio lentus]